MEVSVPASEISVRAVLEKLGKAEMAVTAKRNRVALNDEFGNPQRDGQRDHFGGVVGRNGG